MKTILLPTDFSDNSSHAIDYVIGLFGLKPQYVLLNTYYTPSSGASMVYSVNPILAEESQKALAEFSAELRKRYGTGLKLREKSILGSVPEVCGYLVNDSNINLIAMGTKGASGLAEIILGSNTASTIRLAKRPVLAVPMNAKLGAPKHIALAIDYRDIGSEQVLDPLVELMNNPEAKLSVVHVLDEDTDDVLLNAETPPKVLNGLLDKIPHRNHQIDEDDVLEGLEEFVDDENVDMLVMIEHEYSFIKSFFHRSMTKRMAMHTEVPLLALQDVKPK